LQNKTGSGFGKVINAQNNGAKEMEILKYTYNEICCFIKATFDISIQKLQQIFNL